MPLRQNDRVVFTEIGSVGVVTRVYPEEDRYDLFYIGGVRSKMPRGDLELVPAGSVTALMLAAQGGDDGAVAALLAAGAQADHRAEVSSAWAGGDGG